MDGIELLEKVKEVHQELKLLGEKTEQLNNEIHSLEKEQEDILHELELSRLNAVEIVCLTKQLIEVRKTRRKLKNEKEILHSIDRNYKSIGTMANVINNTEQVIYNIGIRKYTPRIRNDLKIGRE